MGLIQSIIQFCAEHVVLSLVISLVVIRAVTGAIAGQPKFEEYPGNKVQEISTLDEYKAVLNKARDEGKIVILDAFAHWCGPCRTAAPKYGQMSIEYDDVVFVKVDVDKASAISREVEVQAMPTFAIFKNGVRVEKMTGFSESKIRSLLQKHRK